MKLFVCYVLLNHRCYDLITKKNCPLAVKLAGTSLERVQRVHLHPLKFGNGCNAPVLNGTLSTKNHQLGKNHRF